MFNPNKPTEIVFPHFINTTTLDGIAYNATKLTPGGQKSIGAFGLTTNNFLGGKCLKMGFIKELGFYGCLNKYDQDMMQLCGFYLDDPDTVTPYGKMVIEKALSNNTIKYVRYDELPKTEIDEKYLKLVQDEAKEHGIAPHVINGAAVETLESLIKAAKFEQALERKQQAEAEKFADKTSGDADDLITKSAVKRTTTTKVSVKK